MADDKSATDEAKKEEKKVSKEVEGLVEEISKLSVLQLSELVEALQEKLGVTAMAPVAAAPAPAASAAAISDQPASGGSDTGGAQNLVMTSAGENKIAVIKALREINQNWGLKEAKDMTEAVPVEILKGAKPEEVKEAAEKLKAAGATVELK